MMHGQNRSAPEIAAIRTNFGRVRWEKPANKAAPAAPELVERRVGTKGNAGQQSTLQAQDKAGVSQALDRKRPAVGHTKKERSTAILHHINPETLRLAFNALKKDEAPQVDGVTWSDYEVELEHKLEALRDWVHGGTYRPQPSRRVYTPKADGRQRPLTVAAVEDKVVQGAVTTVLSAIYEVDFLRFSHGFRSGRGNDVALVAGISNRKVNWIPDADSRCFFDMVDQKWMKTGALEDGEFKASEGGTGQGSVISPLLANMYLHYTFDLWANRWRQREVTGDMIIFEYADDTVAGFKHEVDARRFLKVPRTRLEGFALSPHPERTRLIEFGRHAAADREQRRLGKPETFKFLGGRAHEGGSTLICSKSRKGQFLKERHGQTICLAKHVELKEEMRRRMHWPIPEQGEWLKQIVGGFFTCHDLPTNNRVLAAFGFHVRVLWGRTLRRRSQKERTTGDRISGWLRMAPTAPYPTPLAKRSLGCQIPEAGAACGQVTRTDLGGGRPLKGVSTAIGQFVAASGFRPSGQFRTPTLSISSLLFTPSFWTVNSNWWILT
jgi:RNA-directed DNA polymerase